MLDLLILTYLIILIIITQTTTLLDIFSLFHRIFLNNTELKIFGCHWESTQDRLFNAQALCH